jgi:hypothetical protein
MKITFKKKNAPVEKKKRKTIEERIAWLESEVGTEKEPENKRTNLEYLLAPIWLWDTKKTIREEAKELRKDFEELDHKFDLLERYLGIEYFKVDEQTATYDWADKTSNEGFRKAKKSFEDMKKEKEEATKADSCCD